MQTSTAINTSLPNASAGAAFLLQDRPACTAIVPIDEGATGELNPECPYLVVRHNSGGSDAEAETSAHRLAQQALDVYAARGLGYLATRNAEQEFVLWWTNGNAKHLRFVDTIAMQWEAKVSARIDKAVDDAAPAVESFPSYHPAFRFLRLSQLSDDLYDSFRNTYLALELLVSDAVPKGPNERERDWLERAFGGPLADTVPSGLVATDFVEALYAQTRLPLFHAQASRNFFLPQDMAIDRERIRYSLQLGIQAIIHLVNCVSTNAQRGGGAMSRSARHAMCREALSANMLRAGCGEFSDTVPSIEVKVSDACLRFDNPTLLVSFPASAVPQLHAIDTLSLLKDGEVWTTSELPMPFNMTPIDQVEFLIQIHMSNTRGARTLFRR